MNRSLHLEVAKASVCCAAVSIACVFVAALSKFQLTNSQETVLAVVLAYAPSLAAAYWLLGRLRVQLSDREAKKLSLAFAVTAPVCLSVSLVLAEIPIGFAAQWASRITLIVIFASVILISTILNLGVFSFARWVLGLER